MHEMALAQGVVDIAVEQARANNAAGIRLVRLEIGALSHVEPRALSFCFDAVSRGTLAEGAVLEIDRPQGSATCLMCVKTFPLANRYDPCPHCGSHQVVVVGGEEMRVKELEVV